MVHQITLAVPDEIYQPLLQKAQESGRSLKEAAADCLAQALQSPAPGDRILRWVGAWASGVPDAAIRHDDYLGKTLDDKLQDIRMIERFVDTSGWAELADRTLIFHDQAKSLFEEVRRRNGRLVTAGFVLAELTALLTRPLRMPKARQIQLIDDLTAADSLVENSPSTLLSKLPHGSCGKRRPNKEWSLVNCSSFVVNARTAASPKPSRPTTTSSRRGLSDC